MPDKRIIIDNPDATVLAMLHTFDVEYIEEDIPVDPLIPNDTEEYWHPTNFPELLKRIGTTQIAFSKKHDIPYRTINAWCVDPGKVNYRDCPQYLMEFISASYHLKP